jgi:uncharacterized phiE125 gp8 family phage protein
LKEKRVAVKLYSAPALEPVTVAEIKDHLKIDSVNLADSLATTQSIAPGAHVMAAAYSLKGAGVSVLNQKALLLLEAGTCGAGASIAVKIQESDTDVDADYEDWTGGAFTTVTEANDNANYEKEYTGTKAYVRTVATVAVGTCSFGTTVVTRSPYSYEDSVLADFITAARIKCEEHQGRAYITQTWDLYLDDFPEADEIELPRGPLQSITSVKYYGTDGTEYTMSASDYIVDIASDPGRIVLGYGKTWPTTVLRPANGVIIRFVCGYGAAAAAVPALIRLAIKMLVGHYYANREAVTDARLSLVPDGIAGMLDSDGRNFL